MSNAIGNAIRVPIAYWSSNSLMPDACVLIPVPGRAPIHRLYRWGAASEWMGCSAAIVGGVSCQ